jgi:hypothetical protein
MNARTTLVSALAAAALTVMTSAAAHGAPTSVDRFDRSAFDSAGVATGSGYSMQGATSGELGGYLTLAIEATDGTLPAQGECETAHVQAVLTVSPGESFAIDTTGELCSHFISGTPILNAYFGARQVEYSGAHKRARVSDGIIGFTKGWLGAQGSVGLSVRW